MLPLQLLVEHSTLCMLFCNQLGVLDLVCLCNVHMLCARCLTVCGCVSRIIYSMGQLIRHGATQLQTEAETDDPKTAEIQQLLTLLVLFYNLKPGTEMPTKAIRDTTWHRVTSMVIMTK